MTRISKKLYVRFYESKLKNVANSNKNKIYIFYIEFENIRSVRETQPAIKNVFLLLLISTNNRRSIKFLYLHFNYF